MNWKKSILTLVAATTVAFLTRWLFADMVSSDTAWTFFIVAFFGTASLVGRGAKTA